ncbi:MAG: protein-L-isoaspartate(D-aspartate) O-methyltransferase [Deltaproteobacteria bacterium]|nr:protein-L-isoaspartate(D-aspartate) O-methyltransferase [Deltaproteobacteria bacterium]
MSTITSSFRTNRRFSLTAPALVLFSILSWLPAHGSQAGPRASEGHDPFARARAEMIERDLRGRGIKNARVLAAMDAVPRHLFVPEPLRAAAYEDRPLPIGAGQTISQPYIVAFMTELLELKGDEKVLEIGTGSGYQAAVLARLAREVCSIEILPALSERAREVLLRLGFANVHLKVGDGFFGWREKGPFDAILLTAAALREGGRLVMPLGEERRAQRLMRFTKTGGKPVAEDLTAVLFVPLTGAIREEAR